MKDDNDDTLECSFSCDEIDDKQEIVPLFTDSVATPELITSTGHSVLVSVSRESVIWKQ